jgi:Dullard-like phosphatase family protein
METLAVYNTFMPPMHNQPQVIHKRISKKTSFLNLFNLISNQYVEYYTPPPEKENKKTLVLDLDETLVHYSTFLPHPNVKSIEVGSPSFTVWLRPGLEQFLKFALHNFDVFVYTYGDRSYAKPILDVILPSLDENHRLYRDSCQIKKGNVFKDLGMFERKQENLILVDDNRAAARFHPQNTLQITNWEGSPKDDALLKWLIPILKKCLYAEDVRDIVSKVPKLGKLYSY